MCPAGGEACVVVGATYEVKGGVPTVAVAYGPIDVTGLGSKHGLTGAEPVTIPAGETKQIGNVNVTCPGEKGDFDCVVLGASYEATGGMPTVASVFPQPTFQPVELSVPGDDIWGKAMDYGRFYLEKAHEHRFWGALAYVVQSRDRSGSAPVGRATYTGGMVGKIANDERRVYGDVRLVYENLTLDARFSKLVAVDGGDLDKRSFSIDDILVSSGGWFSFSGKADGVFAGPNHEEVFGYITEPNFHNGNSLHGAFGADKQ